VIRIAGTGVISIFWGAEAAEGFFHGFSGWAVFMLCFAFYALLNYGLKFLPGKKSTGPQGAPAASAHSGKPPQRQLRWDALAVVAAIVLITPMMVSHLGSVPPKPLQQPLTAFPMHYDSWVGKTSQMDESIWERVGGQEYIDVNYSQEGVPPVNFYTAYYEYQRKAGDFVHSPKLCLPGAGWFIEKNRVRQVQHNGDETLYGGRIVFNEMVISKSNHRQLVYYWYQGRGRNFTNEYMAKFYMVWDGIFRRRTDGALVRLVRTIAPGETVEQARKVLDEFVVFTGQKLEEYLPS
jgi:EpsI family protein